MKAFLKAGLLRRGSVLYQRTPSPALRKGGILSPLLANIALSVLDEHFAPAVA